MTTSHTLVRIILCAVMAYQGYQLGAEYGRALKAWVKGQEASSTLSSSRP